MSSRLPSQIKKVEAVDCKTGKSVARWEVRVDGGTNPATGQRQQIKRRFSTERAARTELAKILDAAAKQNFVARGPITVEEVCADYLAGRHNLRPTSRSKLGYDLAPLRERFGALPVKRLTKAHLDGLVGELWPAAASRLKVGHGGHGVQPR